MEEYKPPGNGDFELYHADRLDFTEYRTCDFIVHGSARRETPCLTMELPPADGRFPLSVVAMNNSLLNGSGLYMIYWDSKSEDSYPEGVYRKMCQRYTDPRLLNVIMRNELTSTRLNNRVWEAFRWGDIRLRDFMKSVMHRAPDNDNEYKTDEYQEFFFEEINFETIVAYVLRMGLAHTARGKEGMVITRLSWSWSASNSSREKIPLDLKSAISRVGGGLWATLVDNTKLQSDKTYRKWANLEGSRLMREYFGMPSMVGVVPAGFESMSINLYILNANGEHFYWNEHGVDPADDQYETSVLLITNLVYIWKQERKPKEQLIHLVFRFNASKLGDD